MEELLLQACKKLHFGSGLVTNAKKIKAKNHLDFLLELFTEELEERQSISSLYDIFLIWYTKNPLCP